MGIRDIRTATAEDKAVNVLNMANVVYLKDPKISNFLVLDFSA